MCYQLGDYRIAKDGMNPHNVSLHHWMGRHYIGHFRLCPSWLSAPTDEVAARPADVAHIQKLAKNFKHTGSVSERISVFCSGDVWDARNELLDVRALVGKNGLVAIEGNHSRRAATQVAAENPSNPAAVCSCHVEVGTLVRRQTVHC